MRWGTALALAIAAVALLVTGCADPVAKPRLTLAPQNSATSAATPSTVQPQHPLVAVAAPAPEPLAVPAGDMPEVFAAVQQDAQPAPPVEAAPTADDDGYQTVGGVLAEVNGKPIFTDQVIASVRNELRGLARQQPSLDLFLPRAKEVLEQELRIRIENEVLRLVAERNLSPGDRRRAIMAATQFRVNRVTAAGGSEARARELAAQEEGMTLEKLVEDQEQRFLVQIFYQNVILPRAAPSAAEIREYYLRHPEVHSTQGKGEIEFQLIEFSAGGTPEQLQARAKHVRELAEAGEDFEALARAHNDNPVYKESGGVVPGMPLGRGDFRWPAVDAAVWSTAEGQLAPLVSDDEGRRWFLAKVTRRLDPQSIGFDVAQSQIRERITDHRQRQLIQQYKLEAQQYAAVTPAEQISRNLQTALEVVAQQHQQWRADDE